MAIEQELLDSLNQLNQSIRSMGGAGSRTVAGSAGGAVGARRLGLELEDAADAAKDLSNSLGRARDTSFALMGFKEGLDDVSSVLTTVLGAVGLGALGGIIANAAEQFRGFLQIGQTFNGSMMQMGKTAAQAHMSLDQFSRGFRAAGAAGATLGTEQFGELSDAVRQNIRQFGSFGLKIDEANEYLGDQLDVMRITGTLESMTRQQLVDDFNHLQTQTMGLSSITGKARDEILKQTMALQKNNAAFIGYMGSIPSQMRSTVQRSVQDALNIFSALPGQAGETFGKALTEGLALGSTYMSSTFSEIAVMAPNVANSLEEVRRTAESGGDVTEASIDTVLELQNMTQETMSNLMVWAASGDQAATELLHMAEAAKGVRIEELRERMERAQRMAPFEQGLMNFSQNMATVFGEIRFAVLAFLKPTLDYLTGNGPGQGALGGFADWIRSLVDDGLMEEWGQGFANAVQGLVGWVKNLTPSSAEFKKWWLDFKTDLTDFGIWIGIINKDTKKWDTTVLRENLRELGASVGFYNTETKKWDFAGFMGNVQAVGAWFGMFNTDTKEWDFSGFLTRLGTAVSNVIDLLLSLAVGITKGLNALGLASEEAVETMETVQATNKYKGVTNESARLAQDVEGYQASADLSMGKMLVSPVWAIKDWFNQRKEINTIEEEKLPALIASMIADKDLNKAEQQTLAKLMKDNVELSEKIKEEIAKQTQITAGMSKEEIKANRDIRDQIITMDPARQ